eukprot:5851102-Amphidinium_carterae.1
MPSGNAKSSESGAKSSPSAWLDVAPNESTAPELTLDPQEWSVATTQRLCVWYDGVAIVEAKDLGKLRVRFAGVPNKFVAVGIGEVPSTEMNVKECAFHVTKTYSVGGETKREVMAVRGWRVDLGVASDDKATTAPSHVVKLDALASRICAADLPKDHIPDAEWQAFLSGKRTLVRDKLRLSWANAT